MRHVHPLAFVSLCLFVVSLGAGVLGLAGCTGTTVNPRGFAPASLADVDQVREEAKSDREATGKAFGAVREDLTKAQIATDNLSKAEGDLKAHADEIAARPMPSGLGGALVNAIAGSGVLPGWLDWLVTLGATALGINVARNKTRKQSLAKVKTEAVLAATLKTPPTTPTV